MILMYHKVHPDSPSMWWVTVDQFYRQLSELQAKTVVYLDDYDLKNPDQVVITFDGVYDNVLYYAAPLLKKFGYPFELFITGDYVGKNNRFDVGEAPATFASIQQLTELVKLGGRLQWHTRSHPKLDQITDLGMIKKELSIPAKLKNLDPKGCKWLAYPHSVFNSETKKIAHQMFKGSLSVIHGSDDDLDALNRVTVLNDTSIRTSSIGVIIPSYNYGSFLVEAVESVLRQTVKPTKILIVDDASTDNTQEIGRAYARRYPELVQFHRNQINQGIIKTFNQSVNHINTNYVCFLGADNRFKSDYIEKCAIVLDQDPAVAIAYTDTEVNFIHGSSLYRKAAFDEAGGYIPSKKRAEDHGLFMRMIEMGWTAKRVPDLLLEYRQHSKSQANTVLNSFAELNFYKKEYYTAVTELSKIKSSKFWKLLYLYKEPKKALKHYLSLLLTKVVSKINHQIQRL
ncbi:MAG: hypothetical protein COY81_00365 [Candidatus Pacebacteria bacterium CG_4_10_14_0_8_um_filter_43_12]|nr:MAG: hypothetical protein COY81_00365 [Candidatus Pacebacteria bacterium CG_4_10_14_0_8_um_filter_43_12]